MSESMERVADMALGDFAAALASAQATPGGGSAAAVAASLAASLTSMVVRLSIGRPRYESHEPLLSEALAVADPARERFLRLADDDAAAYAEYMAARRLPHGTPEEELLRASATRDAARRAASVPLAVVQECHRLVDLVERLAGRSNPSVASDLDVAALLLEATARGAAANVMANLPAIEDEGFSEAVLGELDQRLRQIQGTSARTRERVRKDGQRRPEPA